MHSTKHLTDLERKLQELAYEIQQFSTQLRSADEDMRLGGRPRRTQINGEGTNEEEGASQKGPLLNAPCRSRAPRGISRFPSLKPPCAARALQR